MGWVGQGLQALIDGVLTGGVYAMVGVGLSLIFGVMRVVNFGHGEFVALGMYGALLVSMSLKLDPYVALLLVPPVAYALGYFTHRAVLSRLLGANEQTTKLATLGIGLILSNLLLLQFGAQPQTVFTEYATNSWPLALFGLDLRVSEVRFIAVAVTVLVITGLNLVLYRTELGRAIRATAQNRLGAELQGVDTKRIHAIVFGTGVLLAATAGVLLLPLLYATPTVGTAFTTKAFVVTVLGGLGSLPGAIGGGLILGVVESLGSSLLPLIPALGGHFGANYRDAYGLLIFLLVLLFRPEGLFGRTVKRV
ncbi:MAG TPA: branched-chain amino acid ABC transporter permease [Deinococcales bacterium]|nr:branched-chain amino acid ABC transporter permease [Deinococcales bacterium]